MINKLQRIYQSSGIRGLNSYLDRNDIGAMTLEDIGKVLGITRERVRQIERSALKKLKHPRVAIKLKRYVDSNDNGLSNESYFGGVK